MIHAARIASALADMQPGKFFIVDANGGLTIETALRMLRLLPNDLDFVFEVPCAVRRECVSLRQRTNVPIIFDELAVSGASVIKMIADDAAEGIALKISKAGGLTKGRHQRGMCIAAGYIISVQETCGSEIAFAAIVHLGQTILERLLRCVLERRDIVTMKTADGALDVHDGNVTEPNTPGLGTSPRLAVSGESIAIYF